MCQLPNVLNKKAETKLVKMVSGGFQIFKKGGEIAAVQSATLTQPTMLHAQYVRCVLNEILFLMGFFLLREVLLLLLSVRSQADREGACDCMQQIIAPKIRAAPSALVQRVRGAVVVVDGWEGRAHARSLRFSLEDFLTAPFLLSSFSTFSLWSSTFIMVSLASVTWSITSLQRCMLPCISSLIR